MLGKLARHMRRSALAAILPVGLIAAALAPSAVAHDLSATAGCLGDSTPRGVAFGDPVDHNGDLTACYDEDTGHYRDNHIHGATGGGSGGGWNEAGCRGDDELKAVADGYAVDANRDFAICVGSRNEYDNRVENQGGGGGWNDTGCRGDDTLKYLASPGHPVDANHDLAICLGRKEYDNRLPNQGGGSGGNGWNDTGCRGDDALKYLASPGHPVDANQDLAICLGSGGEYDNRLAGGGGSA